MFQHQALVTITCKQQLKSVEIFLFPPKDESESFSNEEKIGSCQILYTLSGGYESRLTLREYYLFGNAIQGQLKIYHIYNIHLILIFIKTHSAQNKGKTTYSKGGHGKHGEKLKNFSPKNNLNFAAISILNGESRMVGHLKEMLERSFWWEIPR